MLYRVYKIQTLTTDYEVEASSEDEAEALVKAGKVKENEYSNETTYEVELAQKLSCLVEI